MAPPVALIIYYITFSTVLLFMNGAKNAQNAPEVYNDLIAVGFSWERASSDALLQEFVGPSGQFAKDNGTQTFRIVSHKMEKWKELLEKHNDVNAELMYWAEQRTAVWISTKPDEMNLAELMLLHCIANVTHNSLIIIDSGSESSERISVIIRKAANCNFGVAASEISPAIYFCNGAVSDSLINQLEMTYGIEVPQSGNLEVQTTMAHSWMPRIFTSAAEHRHQHATAHHNMHHHNIHHAQHQHHVFGRYRKRRVYSKKYELLKQRRKQETLQKTRKEASDILDEPIARRKLLCKYRKSCYETGVVPNTWNIYNLLPEFLGPHAKLKNFSEINTTKVHEIDENETKKEISETELKLLCRYRKSCYEEVGAEIEKGYVNVQVVPILARRFAIVLPPKKQKTIKEIASIALAKVEERERLAAQRPIPKKVIIDKKLNEMEEQMKKRLHCKYRKSCYESGIVPEFGSPFSNPFPKIYNFLRRQIHGPNIQEIIHKEFKDLEEDEKRIYCKYRKSCYATGEKPMIQHGQLFKYAHVIKKHEELIPLEIRCKYRKSCYETGILPELNKKKPVEEEAPPEPVKTVTSLYDLKLLCRYRKSCYRQKMQEPENANDELFAEIAKMDKADAGKEKKRKTEEVKRMPSLPSTEEPTERKDVVTPVENVKKKAKSARKVSVPEAEKIKDSKAVKEVKPTPEKKPAGKETGQEKVIRRSKASSEIKKKTVTLKGREEKVERTAQKPKKKRTKEPVEEKKGKAVRQEVTAPSPTTTGKVLTEKEIRKAKPKKKAPKPKKVEQEEKEIKTVRIKKEKPAKEKQLPVKKQQEVQKQERPENETQPVTPPITTEMPPVVTKVLPSFSRPENITPEMLPRKVNIYDDNLSPLDIKLRCKYRKSCYEKGELPPILHAKTIKHLREKDEQHKPLEIRCKYRKSCYKTGKLPENLHENFKVVHLIEKKEEHKPLTLRCKYRKSCYETGELPQIEKNIFGFSALQNLLKKYEEKEFTEKELSAGEKKLRCKYRKSCYETGILPKRLNQTVHIIASSIKEQYMSPQLKCKYRKSCYENMKLDIQLDKVRKKEEQKKPQEGIIKREYETEPLIKYKEKEQKEDASEEEITDEEREHLRKEKIKKMKPGVGEEEYMQIEQLDKQLRPTEVKKRPLSSAQKLKCKYRLKCYDGEPVHKVIEDKRIEEEKQVNIKDFRRANGAICNIYYISCRKKAGLPIRERAPIGRNGRRLCRKKKKGENAN